MVEVKLAGYNVDADLLEKIKNQEPFDSGQLTPETIAAAYARISRDPSDISELRARALEDVSGARASCKNIVFAMGHKSIGNHVLFNFDITNISRLVVEDLEARRLGCGYTEKSQRYVQMEGADVVFPQEFSPDDQARFRELVELQTRFYCENYKKLVDYFCRQKGNENRTRSSLESYAKEDARYSLGLGTETQVGTTFNATALEQAIRTMKYSELAEVRKLADKLFDCVKDIAPSLILYTDTEIFQKTFPGRELYEGNFKETPVHLKEIVSQFWSKKEGFSLSTPFAYFKKKGDVTLVNPWEVKNNDFMVMVSLLHKNSLRPFSECCQAVAACSPQQRKAFMAEAWKYVSQYDNPPREFELATPFNFEIILSSSAYAQLKRHRIMTLLGQDYDPSLGLTIPDSVRESGLEQKLKNVGNRSADLYYQFQSQYGLAATYCLTNAHNRKVIVGINARELNAFARLRCDSHAQWDIRRIAHDMLDLAKEAAPLSLLLACGKDEFEKLKQETYSTPI